MNATFLSEQYLQVVPTELLMAFSMSMKGSGLTSLMLNPEKQKSIFNYSDKCLSCSWTETPLDF